MSASGVLIGITYREADSKIYVCDNTKNLFSLDPQTLSVTQVGTMSIELQSLEIIPSSFSTALAGQLVGGERGRIVAVNPSSMQETVIATTGTERISDIIFSDDGSLYAVSYSNIYEIDSAGNVTTLSSSFSHADGVALDPVANRLFVADSGSDQLLEFDLNSNTITNTSNWDFDSGFFTSGLLWGNNKQPTTNN